MAAIDGFGNIQPGANIEGSLGQFESKTRPGYTTTVLSYSFKASTLTVCVILHIPPI